jgi:hypothetical protein
MKEIIKEVFREMFGGCSTIVIIKRIIAYIIGIVVLATISGADKNSAETMFLVLGVSALTWWLLKLSDAFKE